MRILITGGAGFIGSWLADDLLANQYHVRVLDNLSPQVHGVEKRRPSYLNTQVEFIEGDVRCPDTVHAALDGIDAVFHLAAAVGVGQSMYNIAEYMDVNGTGTGVLLETLIKKPVRRLVVASSMSLYGEGLYLAPDGRTVSGTDRSLEQLKAKEWELRLPEGHSLTPVPTHESKRPSLASIYALSKFATEQMALVFGRAYDIPVVALRFFNVYGPRQALSNPYTGVMAIFASRLLHDRPPMIFEDGQQRRDFVSVHDVVSACRLALEVPLSGQHILNIGSGQSYAIQELAERLAQAMGKEHISPTMTGQYRMGDVRHCFADTSLAGKVLGFRPKIALQEGLLELVEWLEGQEADDRVEQASAELASKGLTI